MKCLTFLVRQFVQYRKCNREIGEDAKMSEYGQACSRCPMCRCVCSSCKKYVACFSLHKFPQQARPCVEYLRLLYSLQVVNNKQLSYYAKAVVDDRKSKEYTSAFSHNLKLNVFLPFFVTFTRCSLFIVVGDQIRPYAPRPVEINNNEQWVLGPNSQRNQYGNLYSYYPNAILQQ